jgi:hypothetical protein
MEDNHNRFKNHLPALMARHGILNVGRWTATAGPNGPLFVYLMVYEDLSQRETQWNSFYGDDEWWQIRAQTNAGAQMVERFDLFFLRSNPIWTPSESTARTRIGGVQELTFLDVALGHNVEATKLIETVVLPLIKREGGQVMMVADFVSGVAMPRIAMMTAWPDAARLHSARRAIDSDQSLRAAFQANRETIGRASLGRTETFVLEPTAFDLPLAALGLTR